jgi:hypothetical protein
MRMTRMTGVLVGLLVAGALPLSAQAVRTDRKTSHDSSTATSSSGAGGTSGSSGSVVRSWVDTGSSLPPLNAGANAVAIEHMHIENEGFEVDTPKTETNPSLSSGASLSSKGVIPNVMPPKDTGRESHRP